MNKPPKLAPLFVAFSVVLSALPQAALAQAQAAARAIIAPGEGAVGIAAAGVTGSPALAALPTFAPLNPGFSASALAPAMMPAAAEAAPAAAAVLIPAPDAALTGIAAEAVSYAGDAKAAAPAARKGLIGRLVNLVRGRTSNSAFFDASVSRGVAPAPIAGRMGIRESKPILLPNGSRPDEQPTTPLPDREPTVLLQTYSLPGARDVGGVLEASRAVLNVDPNDMAAIIRTLKGIIDADRARYGIPSSALRLIAARKFDGYGEQADSIFIHFRQLKDNLIVNGANLSFTLKVIDGKPMVVAQTGQLFPRIDVDNESTLTDAQIMDKIAERIGIPVADATSAFQFSEEKIIYSHGAWRHVKLYVADGLPFMVAVDLATGVVFAWDNRTGLDQGLAFRKKKGKDADAGAGGAISGKAVDHGPILPTARLKNIPLAFLNLTIGDKTYTTDNNGKFSAGDLNIPAGGLTLAATLSGPFVNIQDTTGRTLTINVTLKPGDGAIAAVFNPDSTLNDENAIAQVSAFHKVNLAYNFLRERKLTTEQMDKNALVVRTNVDDECNAYYTPGSPSLNFFKSSANCVNSAYDTVADHEYGHYWDDSTGGIMNGGLSEGWGDTVSMYLLNNPIIGEHFLKVPGPDGRDYIRTGENLYQYNEHDEVHEQGQAWQGFTWKLRKALIEKLGPAAGAALAEALVLPTMFAKAATIPDAINQVLVNAMKKDGTIQYEDLIRSIAKIHGITLAGNNRGFVASLVDRFTAPLRKLRNVGLAFDSDGQPDESTSGLLEQHLAATNAPASVPTIRAKMRFSAGALLRRRVANQLRRYLDETGLKYTLNEYKGWMNSDFLLVIEGPQDEVSKHAENISRWFKSIERDNS